MTCQFGTGNRRTFNVLGVYAPNIPSEKTAFFQTIELDHRIHLMLGDSNIVTAETDRNPPHKDPAEMVQTLERKEWMMSRYRCPVCTVPQTHSISSVLRGEISME